MGVTEVHGQLLFPKFFPSSVMGLTGTAGSCTLGKEIQLSLCGTFGGSVLLHTRTYQRLYFLVWHLQSLLVTVVGRGCTPFLVVLTHIWMLYGQKLFVVPELPE